MKNKLVYILIFVFFINFSCSENAEKQKDTEVVKKEISEKPKSIYSEDDIKIVENILQKAAKENWSKYEINDIVVLVGKEFLGTKYVGGVLDKNETEVLTINLQSLDCLTFVESCSVLACLIKQNEKTFEKYIIGLKNIRYRNGEISGYLSRIHYFSDWLYENEKSGTIKQFAKKIANTKKENSVFFMSKNPDKYTHLNNDSVINNLKKIEKKISEREYYYIPENEIDNYKNEIKSGYITGITTNVAGLDIAHTGIAIHINGELHLLHASSRGKKVEISKKTLQKMLNDNKIQTGIMVAKLNRLDF